MNEDGLGTCVFLDQKTLSRSHQTLASPIFCFLHIAPSELFSKYENFPTLSKVTSQCLVSHRFFSGKKKEREKEISLIAGDAWDIFGLVFPLFLYSCSLQFFFHSGSLFCLFFISEEEEGS